MDMTLQQTIARDLLRQTPDAASPGDIERLLGPPRRPGTAAIGDRKRRPELFQDTLRTPLESYPSWRDRTLREAQSAYRRGAVAAGVDLGRFPEREAVEAAAASILEMPTREGLPLCDAVPQQMYEDVMLRLVSMIHRPEAPPFEVHLYSAFNVLCHRLGCTLLDMAAGGPGPGEAVERLIRLSVLSGAVGVNLKSTASAASTLLNRERLPIPEDWASSPEAARAVPAGRLAEAVRDILAMADGPEGRFGLSSMSEYRREVVEAPVPTLLVFLSDDYLESLIDLRRFETMLAGNPNLRVLFVPRNGRYGNDLAFGDVAPVLEEGCFADLRRLAAAGRMHVSPNGPRAGCIDPRDVSAALLAEVDALGAGRRIVLETKGCRNFEMLRGELPVAWYAGFNCNRALSIRTVEVDGPPVFFRVPPGLRAYDGFERPRVGASPSFGTAGVRFARMTTRRLFDVLATPAYRRLLASSRNEWELNHGLTALGDSRGATLADLFPDSGASPDLPEGSIRLPKPGASSPP
jgi:hypothetical protein